MTPPVTAAWPRGGVPGVGDLCRGFSRLVTRQNVSLVSSHVESSVEPLLPVFVAPLDPFFLAGIVLVFHRHGWHPEA